MTKNKMAYVNLLKTKRVCFIKGLGAYRTVNTPPRLYKINLLMLYKAKSLFVRGSIHNTNTM
jgi:hypothetical protein